MALTVDGIRIPAYVQAKGEGAIEAYLVEQKQKIGMPHPMPALAKGEDRAARDAQWATKIAELNEANRAEDAKLAEQVAKAEPGATPPVINGPPVPRAQHKAQPPAQPAPAPSPAPEPSK